ncbi:hypothetical protein BD311DRAFT_452418 [Dichomitus squalens]|uniref:HMG box domain-containing protein n=1 Tax=Dichomitus squalens TaxID=114155 RepID=A0A4Q9MHM6_9APHY|nr:hypothetical protein BD311DRAFT_452418 [Dichomitus squalens]
MPAFRNIRRSRRISKQPPRDPNLDEYDAYDLQLMYPDTDAASSSPPTLDAPLPLQDESGEPEIDPRSPPSSSSVHSVPHLPRSSHSRKKKPGHIPRPPNAFLIFRSELWNKEKIKSSVERDHRQISRIAGKYWQELSDAERAPYHVKAEEAKRLHALTYPDYKYSPVYRKDRATKRKTKSEDFEKVLRCERVALLMRRGFEGDDLVRELQRDSTEDGYTSDAASEYAETRRPRKARKSATKRLSSAQRPRHPRTIHTVVKEELMQDEGSSEASVEPTGSLVDDVPIHDRSHSATPVGEISPAFAPLSSSYDVVPKEEPSTPNISKRSLSPPCTHDNGEQAFVLQDEIPEIRLGSPAFSPKVEFTDPFAKVSCSPHSEDVALFSCDPFTPLLAPSSPSSDFMGVAGDDPLDGSEVFANGFDFSLFDVKGDLSHPGVEGPKPAYNVVPSPADHPYSPLYFEYLADQSSGEVDYTEYSAWVHIEP